METKLSHNQEIGQKGEQAAVKYLERHGYEILDRNWTCIAGEADIIAKDDDVLVFVEVKTRTNDIYGLPEEAVDRTKRKRYENIALAFLSTCDITDIEVRFDVVALVLIGDNRALLRHHINAFASGE